MECVHGSDEVIHQIHGFNNGETRVEIGENIRNQHIIIVCRTRNRTVNDDFLSMCMILDACNRADVSKITVILPYYPYARSDKKDDPRVGKPWDWFMPPHK